MNNDTLVCLFLQMPLTRIKMVRKAVRLLVSVGVSQDYALEIILQAISQNPRSISRIAR